MSWDKRYDYQVDQVRSYDRSWADEHREARREAVRRTRSKDPKKTAEQNTRNWRNFVKRNPERWKEINQKAQAKRAEKEKAARKALKEMEEEK